MNQLPKTLAERLEALEARVACLESSQAGGPASASAPVDEMGAVAGRRGRKRADDKPDEAAEEVTP